MPMWSEGLLAMITKSQRSPSTTARIWLCDLTPFFLNQGGLLYSSPELYMEKCTEYIVGIIKYE